MKRSTRAIAALLCLVFLLSLVPVTAAETPDDVTVYRLASTMPTTSPEPVV